MLAAPAAVLLASASTPANDTLIAKGIPIGPPLRETRVDVGDLGADLNLGAKAFSPAPSPASGSPPLVPPESGPMREDLTPPAPLPPLPGFATPDMGAPTASEGFAPSGGDVPIILEARKPLGPDVPQVTNPYPGRRSHTPALAQRMNNCAASHHGPRSAGMLRHLAPFWWRQNTAEMVRRSSFGGVLPRGRTASINGSHTAQAASVKTWFSRSSAMPHMSRRNPSSNRA